MLSQDVRLSVKRRCCDKTAKHHQTLLSRVSTLTRDIDIAILSVRPSAACPSLSDIL